MADDEHNAGGSKPMDLGREFHDPLWNEIEREVRGPAVPVGPRSDRPDRRRAWSAAAAVLVVLVGGGVLLSRHDRGDGRVASSTPSTSITGGTSSNSAASTTAASPSTTADTTKPPALNATIIGDGYSSAIAGTYIQLARMTDATSGWVITDNAIAHTADAGVHWSQQPVASMDATLRARSASFVLDNQRAWIARSNGTTVTIAYTDDGAATLATTSLVTPLSNVGSLGLVFIDPLHGWLSVTADSAMDNGVDPPATGSLYSTNDGGKTFQLLNDNAPAVLAFTDQQTGWAQGQGLFLTRDGGATWTQVYPPGWNTGGPSLLGPKYTIITTTPQRTVIKLYAPTGMNASVSYLATDDLGDSWRDVTPPNSSEANNTGPQSTLSAISPTHWFAIQQTMTDNATLWTTTDAGATYQATYLPFAAREVTMADPIRGLATADSDVYLTNDGGASWTKVANVTTPARLSAGCTWLPNYNGHDGAGGKSMDVIDLTNIGTGRCESTTVQSVTATRADGTQVTATQGGFFPVSPAAVTTDTGERISIVLTTVNALENCGATTSHPVTQITIHFTGDVSASVRLGSSIETACVFAYLVGGPTT